MTDLKILVSHAHDEKGLASAWKELVETLSLGRVEVWFSSDRDPKGGFELGKEWRARLYEKLAESDLFIAIQSPFSGGRSWIMWECAMASGTERIKGIIPVVYGIGRGDLTNPLSSYEVYQGDDIDQVRQVMQKLALEADLTIRDVMYTEPLRVYKEKVELHRPRKPVYQEEMNMWRSRVETLVQTGRSAEVVNLRNMMYASYEKPFEPIDPSVHDLLNYILLEQERFELSIEEANYGLTLSPEDVALLHRRVLAKLHTHDLAGARTDLDKIFAQNAALKENAEIAGLEGRYYRQLHKMTGDVNDLARAGRAYKAAYDADQTQYYPGVNAASLYLELGQKDEARELFSNVIQTCEELRKRPEVSFWVDFTLGEAHLGIGNQEAAISAYRDGLRRYPFPSLRARSSAADGAERTAKASGLPDEYAREIRGVLTL